MLASGRCHWLDENGPLLAEGPQRPAVPRWQTDVRTEGFALQGTLQSLLPPLLQGDAGFSRKGPEERQASHYYSLPQLATRGTPRTANTGALTRILQIPPARVPPDIPPAWRVE